MAISYEKYRLLRESFYNLGIFDPLAEKKKHMGEDPEENNDDEEMEMKKKAPEEDNDEDEESEDEESEDEESEDEESEDEESEDEESEEDDLPDDDDDDDDGDGEPEEEEVDKSELESNNSSKRDKFCGTKMMKKDAKKKKKCTCSGEEAVEKAEEALGKDLDGDKEKGESKKHKSKVLKKESTEDKFLAIARSYGKSPLVKDREVMDFKSSIRNHLREGAKRHGNWDGISMKEDMLLARGEQSTGSADGEIDQIVPAVDDMDELNSSSKANSMYRELTPEDMQGNWV